MSEELITIRQACARLGVSDRTLRRGLSRPEIASRLITITHRTRTGDRTALAIPSELLDDLAEMLHLRSGAEELVSEPVPVNPETDAQRECSERLIAEKDERILDLRCRLTALEAALRHEQETVTRLLNLLQPDSIANPPRPGPFPAWPLGKKGRR